MLSFVWVINGVKICVKFVEDLEGLVEMFVILLMVDISKDIFK